jgi:hypothetical protein
MNNLHPVFAQIMRDHFPTLPTIAPTQFNPCRADRRLRVKMKDQYGVQVTHPVCDHAKLFAKLAGTKTLTPHALETIRALGYHIEVEF